MDLRLLYFDGCPNWQDTDARLREALQRTAVQAKVVRVRVSSPDEAEQLSFRGSPTILIDGADPFGVPDAPIGFACRVFQTPEGVRGAPTVDQLVEALLRARDRQPGGRSERYREP